GIELFEPFLKPKGVKSGNNLSRSDDFRKSAVGQEVIFGTKGSCPFYGLMSFSSVMGSQT
ncbi:hypothetical protein CEXT_741221, partial [Caerostris extrusa]